nr:MAG TPA: orexin-A [Caudoviricetes sp.]
MSQKVHKCRIFDILHKKGKMILCSRENFCL